MSTKDVEPKPVHRSCIKIHQDEHSLQLQWLATYIAGRSFPFSSRSTSRFSFPSIFGHMPNKVMLSRPQVYPTQIGIRRYGSILCKMLPGSIALTFRAMMYRSSDGYQKMQPQNTSQIPKMAPKILIFSFPNVIAGGVAVNTEVVYRSIPRELETRAHLARSCTARFFPSRECLHLQGRPMPAVPLASISTRSGSCAAPRR